MTRDEMIREENRRIRILRISCDLVVQVIMTQRLPLSEVDRMISGVRDLAVKLFPGKEHVFDLIYLPRFRRAMREAGMVHPGMRPTLAEQPDNAAQQRD